MQYHLASNYMIVGHFIHIHFEGNLAHEHNQVLVVISERYFNKIVTFTIYIAVFERVQNVILY